MDDLVDPVLLQLECDGFPISADLKQTVPSLRTAGMSDQDIFAYCLSECVAQRERAAAAKAAAPKAPAKPSTTPAPAKPSTTPAPAKPTAISVPTPAPSPSAVPSPAVPTGPAPLRKQPSITPRHAHLLRTPSMESGASTTPSGTPPSSPAVGGRETTAPVPVGRTASVRSARAAAAAAALRRSKSRKQPEASATGVPAPAPATAPATASAQAPTKPASAPPAKPAAKKPPKGSDDEDEDEDEDEEQPTDQDEEEEVPSEYSGDLDYDVEDHDDELFAEDRELTPAERRALCPERDPNDIEALKKEGAFLPPVNETLALGWLSPAQTAAVRYVTSQSQPLSEQAKPELIARAKRLGFSDQQLIRCLRYIRDEAPIIIHFHADRLLKTFAEDTNYRNQFETHTSCGCLNNQTRIEWENTLFNRLYPPGCPGSERCKYGVLNIVNDPVGVRCCSQYGTSYLLLRNVRLRTSFANEDTGGGSHSLASCEYYGHVLKLYSDPEFKAVMEVANEIKEFHNSSVIGTYKEIQIHGEVRFNRDVEAVYLAGRKTPALRDAADKFSKRHGVPIIWMEENT